MPQLGLLVDRSIAVGIRALWADALQFAKNIEELVQVILVLLRYRTPAFLGHFKQRASD